jgi:hypothetical protein
MRKNSIFVNKKRKLKKNKMGTFQGQCLVVLMRYDALLYILLQKPRKVCKIVDGYQKTCLSGLIHRIHIERYFQFKFDQIILFNSVFNDELENNPLKKTYSHISNRKF